MFKLTTNTTITPADVGTAFANGDASEQAEFLAALATAIDAWDGGSWDKQCEWIAARLHSVPARKQVVALLSTLITKLQVAEACHRRP